MLKGIRWVVLMSVGAVAVCVLALAPIAGVIAAPAISLDQSAGHTAGKLVLIP